MPTADSGSVRRDSMPAAMPSCSAPTKGDVVFNSGVSRIPPTAQIEMKKKAQTARIINSVRDRNASVTRSSTRIVASPTDVGSIRQPANNQKTATPSSSSKSRQRTFSSPRGCPATS